MAPSVSTPVAAATGHIPQQPTGSRPVQPVLFPLHNTEYCRLMGNTAEKPRRQRGPWADYITWAAAQVGSVDELAARTELHRTTISAWKTGRKTPETATAKSIRAVAAAVGDDPRNALRAAGRAVDTEGTWTPPAPAAQTLAAELARINERIRLIAESGLPLHEQDAAIETQEEAADQAVARYRRRAEGTDGVHGQSA